MPVTSLALPQNFEQDVAALMPDLLWHKTKNSKSPLARALPFSYTDASFVKWDQYKNPYGLIPLRGVNAPPDSVRMPGLREYVAMPGFYGLVTTLNEQEILFGRQPNTVANPLDVADRLGVLALNGSEMVYNRVRQTGADMLVSGEFTNVSADGTITHKYKIDDYQTFSPANDGNTGPGWAADPANADPIGDLIYWQTKKLNKGTSASFAGDSEIVCNPSVVNDIWNCASVRSAFKSKFGASVLRGEMPNLDGDNSLNALLLGMGLPKLVVDAEGYYETLEEAAGEDPDDFTYFVPDQSLVWIGVRPENQQIGSFKLTRFAGVGAYGSEGYPSVSVANEEAAEIAKGFYVNAHYHNRMPHGYDLEMGFNAAPVLYYRRATAGVTYA